MQIVQHTGQMAQRMSQPVVRRPNLPLTAQDEADLAVLRQSPSHLNALAELSSGMPTADVGESVLLHAIFEAGLRAVREAAEEDGYAQLADDYRRSADERRAMSRRRPPAWADEA